MSLAQTIDEAWDARDDAERRRPRARCARRSRPLCPILTRASCASPKRSAANGIVHQWLKKAVLLSFRLNDMKLIEGAPGDASWWDKVDSKFAGWGEKEFPGRRIPRRARLRSCANRPSSPRASC